MQMWKDHYLKWSAVLPNKKNNILHYFALNFGTKKDPNGFSHIYKMVSPWSQLYGWLPQLATTAMSSGRKAVKMT